MIAIELRELVCRANQHLARSGLVVGTFGNVSAVDRTAGMFAIKASGIPYESLTPEHMIPISLTSGEPLEARWRPSSDTPTHLELYRAFDCGGIVHTHSEYATVFAQARTSIRCMGTTHADYFHGDIPVTRAMTREEVERDYEKNTGIVIVETFRHQGLNPVDMPAVLVANHGPFTWGTDAFKAIELAEILEYVARLEWRVRALAPDAERPESCLVDKHYLRKHGPMAYYGQPEGSEETKEPKERPRR
jgi:L-ribulose-5-phosphate 4-epimerase